MILLICVLAAAVPIALYVLFVWWLDRYEREPIWLVSLTFLWGAVGGVFFGLVGSVALSALISPMLSGYRGLFEVAIVAPVVEEPAKAVVLLLLLRSRHFDNTTDGVVYGAATGLGFAMTENVFYFLGGYLQGGMSQLWTIVVLRTLFSAVMHSCASASFGACIGYFRYRGWSRQWIFGPAIGFLSGALLHSLFNGFLILGKSTGNVVVSLAGLVLVPVMSVVLFIITQLSLRHEHRIIKQELEDEAHAGYLPAQHAAIIPFFLKRRRAGWLPASVDRKAYVKAATLLAFRKHQVRLMPSDTFSKDIDGLRNTLRELTSRFDSNGNEP